MTISDQSRRRHRRVLTALLVVVSTTMGSTAHALSWMEDAFWGQWGNSGPDLDLGSASDRTCFLTGVHGQLSGTTINDASGTAASARVYISRRTNHWYLQTHQGVGNGVNARAACVGYTANRAFFSSDNGQIITRVNGIPFDSLDGWGLRSVVSIPQTSPKRQCFLSGISAWNGFNGDYAPGDTYLLPPAPARTGQSSNAWQFVTDLEYAYTLNRSGQVNGYAPGGSAEAVCFDVTSVEGGVGPLSQPTVWYFSNESNMACGLTWIAGPLASDPLGGDDGVGLSYDDGTGWWGVSATSGKTIATTCFR